jgi:Ulp1 family protease
MKEGYSGIKRWGRNVATPQAIFDGRLLFFPINQVNYHWVLMVGDVLHKKLWYLDSQHGDGADYYCSIIRQYLESEFKSLNPNVETTNNNPITWQTSTVDWNNAPRQNDGYSCGCYMMAFMEAIVQGHSIDFPESEMQKEYRQYLMAGYWLKRPNSGMNETNQDRRNIECEEQVEKKLGRV